MDKSLWDRSHYFSIRYLNEGRFVDYHHTIRLVMRPDVREVLEVGPGNGLVTWILRHAGYGVHTLDCEASVKPDTVGDIRALPFPAGSFDAVICCQVLEHLRFEEFQPILRQFYKVSRKYLVLSLPHVVPVWSVIARLPIFGSFWGSVPIPFRKSIDLSDHPEHFWSVGSKG